MTQVRREQWHDSGHDQADEEARRRAVEEGRRAFAEGRFVEHERVVEWLRSWGTEHELPPPYSQPSKPTKT